VKIIESQKRIEKMSKKYYITFLIFFALLTAFMQPNNNVIEWDKSYKLNWTDFEGKPDKNNEYKAISVASIEFKEMVYNKKDAHGKIKTLFYKTESWTRSQSEMLLKHEQGHFDITEIYARYLRKKLNNKQFKKNTVSKELENIYNKIEQEKNNYQDTYDKETVHGKNSEKNREWEERILKQLDELEEYSDAIVTLKLQ
jgi:hypothetical protein